MSSIRDFHKQVNHPVYYTRGKIEVADFIVQHKLDFLIGNVVKYICRAGFKDDELKDLMKAHWYLKKAIICEVKPPEVDENAINPGDFAVDQRLDAARTSILVNLVFGNLELADELLEDLISVMMDERDAAKSEPKVYGSDEKLLNDTRTVDFGSAYKKGMY